MLSGKRLTIAAQLEKPSNNYICVAYKSTQFIFHSPGRTPSPGMTFSLEIYLGGLAYRNKSASYTLGFEAFLTFTQQKALVHWLVSHPR